MSKLVLRAPRAGGSGTRAMAVIVAIAIAVMFLNRGGQQSSSDDDARVDGTPGSGKYVASGDEGLGASIALVLDVSGSMADKARGDSRPKYEVAREALQSMLEATDSFAVRQPGFRVNVGLYTFSDVVNRVVPIKEYNREELSAALASLGRPRGGTAIGDAMDVAREDLYKAGTIRKYILVVTDGENTDGREPDEVAREIAARSEGAVRQYFVAFDIDKKRFAFLEDVNGEVFGAANGFALRASLDSIYRGKILAEAMNAGETLPPARRDSGGVPRNQQQ